MLHLRYPYEKVAFVLGWIVVALPILLAAQRRKAYERSRILTSTPTVGGTQRPAQRPPGDSASSREMFRIAVIPVRSSLTASAYRPAPRRP